MPSLLPSASPSAIPHGSAAAVLGAAVRHHAAGARLPVSERPVVAGLVLLVTIGAVKVLLRNRLQRRHATSLDLIGVLVGFILLLMLLLPIAGNPGWVGALLFVGLAVIYKLLGYFEEPDGE